MNKAGEEILRQGTTLKLNRGKLECAQVSLNPALAEEASRNAATKDGTVGITRTHQVVLGAADGAPATLRFYPLRGHGTFGLMPGAEVVVFMMRGEDHSPPSGTMLRAAFGLSPGEAELALSLATGERLREVADRRGISIETARTQLKQIFLKTNTRRQSDLISLLHAQSAAALRR
jgi:DNA-binding CsgD family transcriptional regulator